MAIPGIIVYGTSSPLPADLAASNTFTGTNTFSAVTTTNGRRQKITVTAINYTALTTDEIIVCTASVTITLPVASGSGQVYTIVNESVSGTATFVTNTSIIADDSATWDGYTIGQVVQALRNIGLLA